MKADPSAGWLKLAAVVIVALLPMACTTLHVAVEEPRFAPGELLSATAGTIGVQAKPIESLEQYWALFDDNLPEAGIGVVWVALRNSGESEIDTSETRWKLRRGDRTTVALDTNQIFNRYYRGRQIRVYGVSADLQARVDLETALLKRGPIRPAATAHGLIFFAVSPGSRNWADGGTLVADKIRLADGRTATVQIPFPHARP
jgi:hypothetical protein